MCGNKVHKEIVVGDLKKSKLSTAEALTTTNQPQFILQFGNFKGP